MKNILIGLLGLLLMTSCLDEDNNYNYQKINSLEGTKITNLQYSTICYPGETVKFEPKVKLSIDSLHPDLSYEWYVGTELKSQEPTFTFTAEEIGDYTITFCAIDNKTGVKFTAPAKVFVESRWKKGWLLLSRTPAGESQLSIVLLKIEQVETVKNNGEITKKDTIVYVGEDRNVTPDLGSGPIKLVENFCFSEYVYEGFEMVDDEVMVLQDNRCVELHGYSLDPVGYAQEEFAGPVPADFKPVDAVLTYGCKMLLNQDHSLYFAVNSVAIDYHSGRYLSEPALNGKKIAHIIPTNRSVADFILAIDEEEHTLLGIVDDSGPVNSEIPDIEPCYTGRELEVADHSTIDMSWFKNMDKTPVFSDWLRLEYDKDHNKFPSFFTLLQQGNDYYMHVYSLNTDYYRDPKKLEISTSFHKQVSSEMFTDYVDITLFKYSEYAVVASGNRLYRCAYEDPDDQGTFFKDFPAKIKAISSKEIWSDDFGGGHLGVALENGEFYILELIIDPDTEAVTTRELYHGTGFGDVVDVVYKYGNAYNLMNSNAN